MIKEEKKAKSEIDSKPATQSNVNCTCDVCTQARPGFVSTQRLRPPKSQRILTTHDLSKVQTERFQDNEKATKEPALEEEKEK